MDIEAFAQHAALGLVIRQLPNAGKDMNVAIVDVGANVMNVSVMRNERNRGSVATTNSLMDVARGDFIHFAAADDLVLPGF